MVTDSALEAGLRLPAVSAAVAVNECVPGANTLDVIDQAPAALAVPEPTAVVPSNKVTRELAAAVPLNCGVVTSVILSVLEAPLSDAAARSGALGAAGAVVSIVTERTALAGPVLPATSVAFAVIAWMPCASALDVIVQLPPLSAWAAPATIAPLNSVIAEFGSAVPLKTGVVTLVMLSVDEMPLSEAAARSGVLGAAGALMSMVTDSAADATPVLPA